MARSNWDGLDSEEWTELFGVDRAQEDVPQEPTSPNAQDLPPEAVDYWDSLKVWQRSVYLAEAREAAADEDPPLSADEIAQTGILFAWQDAPQSAPDNPPSPEPPARGTYRGDAAGSLPLAATRYWESLTARQRSTYLTEVQDAAAGEAPPLSADEIAETAILFAWQDTLASARNDPPNRPISTDQLPPAANKPKAGRSWLRALAVLGGLAFIVFIVLPIVVGDEDSRDSSTPTPSTALAERPRGAVRAWASAPLPPSVSVKVNAGYRAVSQATADRALGRVVGWYRSVWGLEAERRVDVRLEPACVAPFAGEVDGYAQLEFERVVICVRLDTNAPAALQESEFRDVLAHEYYHAIQFNAPWSGVNTLAECPRFLTEGAASFFGQLYASGAVDDGGLGDVLDVLFDTDRWWHYEEGARAFEALVNRFGDAAVRFWQTDERACADAFLQAFGMSPTRWEEDWRNW